MHFLSIIIMIVVYATPAILTILNIINLFRENKIKEKLIDILTFSLGIVLSVLLFLLWEPVGYKEPIVIGGMSLQLHTPISYEDMPTFLTLVMVALLGYFFLRVWKNKLSPILTIICLSAVYIGIILSVVFQIQLYKNVFSNKGYIFMDVFYMTLFPLNYVLCSIILIKHTIQIHIKKQEREKVNYQNKVLWFCQFILSKSIGWVIIAFIFMLPLLGILIIILVLFGQMPDSAIRAFTQTSDWTLSQNISPPPVMYKGHYLCTVAVNGHSKIVKPTRLGIRQGTKITVNRQLCIANAFEQIIEEKTPKLHKLIRYIYDKYGYPISKHITTPFRADIVYVIMKPLEWLFVLVLYIIETNPENRIAIQYTGKKLGTFLYK